MPEVLRPLPLHLSFSQVLKLAPGFKYACPRSWAYDKRLGLPFVSSVPIEMGKAFDEACNVYLNQRIAGAEYLAATNLAFDTGQACWIATRETVPCVAEMDDAKWNRHLNALGYAMHAFTEMYRDVTPAAVQVKCEFSFKTFSGGTFRNFGYADWIDQDGTIVDNKLTTSDKIKDGEWDARWVSEKRDQIGVYWLSRVFEARRDRTEEPAPKGRLVVCFVNMRTKEPKARIDTLDFDFTDYDRERIIGYYREAHRTAQSGHYPARPGDACGFCSYKDRCRKDEMERGQDFAALTGAVA